MTCHSNDSPDGTYTDCHDAINGTGVSPKQQYSCRPTGCHSVQAVAGDPTKFTFQNTSSNEDTTKMFTAVCNGGKWVWKRDGTTPVDGVNTYECVDAPPAGSPSANKHHPGGGDSPANGSGPSAAPPGAKPPPGDATGMIVTGVIIFLVIAALVCGVYYGYKQHVKSGQSIVDTAAVVRGAAVADSAPMEI